MNGRWVGHFLIHFSDSYSSPPFTNQIPQNYQTAGLSSSLQLLLEANRIITHLGTQVSCILLKSNLMLTK